jgi:hypothetical protein
MSSFSADEWNISQSFRNRFADGSGSDPQHRGIFTMRQLEALAAIFAEAVRHIHTSPPVPVDTNAIAEKALELFLSRLTTDERPRSES